MLFKDKHEDICRFYPIIADEIVSARISVNNVEIEFKSGAKITNITTGSKSKGLRRIKITFEEAALTLSNKTEYADNIQPLTSEPYKSIKNNKPDPYIQTSESFVTTAYYKNDSYDFNVETLEKMVNLEGGFVFGGSYELPCAFKRGKPKEVIESFEERVGTVFFNTNYRSRWIGVNENCIVNIQKLESLRKIIKSELKSDGKSEYLMGVDVARSSKSSNNQTSIMVGKIQRDKKGKIQKVKIVYTTNLPNGLNFTQQSLYIKKLKEKFNVKTIVVDSNGLGIGLVDELLKTTVDPITGDEYPAYDTLNMDIESEEMGAEPCVYGLTSQGIQSEIIVNFMNYVEMEKLQLLVKEDVNKLDDKDILENKILPHVHTDFLIEEVGNVSVKTLGNGKLGIEQNTKSKDKDRVSALIYLLYYIEKYENQVQRERSDVSGYMLFRPSKYK